jgi:hypothetical protein
MGFTYARDDSTHIEDEELFLGLFVSGCWFISVWR